MTLPLPIHHFQERILLAQQVLNGNVTRPLINKRSLLLLSRPVQQLNNALIMDFFGVYWIVTTLGSLGFFADLDEAVRFIVSERTQPNDQRIHLDS
ncbi:hypothetical protein [Prosthecobacter sp.]|uniref:hypothetical protein n=1 Tax=Prosthecobacter sp. TaxID=1965333 RepID=UPI003783AC97